MNPDDEIDWRFVELKPAGATINDDGEYACEDCGSVLEPQPDATAELRDIGVRELWACTTCADVWTDLSSEMTYDARGMIDAAADGADDDTDE